MCKQKELYGTYIAHSHDIYFAKIKQNIHTSIRLKYSEERHQNAVLEIKHTLQCTGRALR